MVPTSPFTGTHRVEPVCAYPTSVTSDSRSVDAPTANYLCLDTGIVFNATGARGRLDRFYAEDYQLHSESAASEFVYFDGGAAVGENDQIIDFVERNSTVRDAGRILDIGCGKGLLLRRFLQRHPRWRGFGVEPSANAKAWLGQVLPGVEVFEGPFESSGFSRETFEVIALNGVLEHVARPLEFLRQIRRCLAPGGVAYVGVPNFANNAADLFTYDHLSRFTPETITWLFAATGFTIRATWASPERVPMCFLLAGGEAADLVAPDAVVAASRAQAQAASVWVSQVFAAYERAAVDARRHGRLLGFYGTGTIGLMGMRSTSLSRDLVYSFFDDNHTLWHSSRGGIPIRSPEEIRSGVVGLLGISANACYWPRIRARIAALTGGAIPVYPEQ